MSRPSSQHPGLSGTLPPRLESGHEPPRLPADLMATPFVGHERLLATLVKGVQSGADRLVTLTGPGGIGKSRLAQELVRQLAPAYGRRIAWIPLASIQDPDLAVTAFAELFGLEAAFGPSPTLASAIAWLGDSPALIILDNAEHLMPGLGPGIGCTLRNCPGVVFIVTSRVALGLEQEREVVVPPLAIPSPGPAALDQAVAPALRLFEERARRAAPGFRLTPDNIDDVVEVCSRLGGMPLAIELAASRTALYSPADLRALGEDLVPTVDSDDGRSTIAHAISWTLGQLTPPERRAVAWLSLCQGGFTLGMAAALCDASPALVSALVDHHLVQAVDDHGGQRRFTMHEVIRQAAMSRLDASGECVTAREAVIRVMRDAARRFNDTPIDRDFRKRLATFANDTANVRQALEWSLDCGDMGSAADLVDALTACLSEQGRFDEMAFWLDRIHAVGGADDPARHPREYAVFYRAAASMLSLQGRHAAAAPLAKRALALAKASGDVVTLARALHTRAWVAIQLRQFPLANRLLHETAAATSSPGHPALAIELHLLRGVSALFQEQLHEAELHLLRTLKLLRAQGEPTRIARVLHFLGYAMAFQGAFDRGRAYLDEALTLVDGDAHRIMTVVLNARSRLELRAGRPDVAAIHTARIIQLRLAHGEYSLLPVILIDAAIVLHRLGNHELAVLALGAGHADEERAKPRTLFNEPGQLTYDALRARYGAEAFRRLTGEGASRPLAELAPVILEALDAIAIGHHNGAGRGLSMREREVLALMAQGHSNPEIAQRLFIGTETVKTHIRHVLQKLEAPSRSAAVAIATREGLVAPPPTQPGMPHRERRPGPASSRGNARAD